MTKHTEYRPARDWWARAVTAVVLVLCVGFTVVYVAISEQKWCELITTLDNPNPPEPDNPRAVSAASNIKELRRQLDC